MKQTGGLAGVLLVGVVLSGTLVCAQEMPAGLRAFFRGPMGLTDSQMTAISRGTAVARTLPSETPAEIVVFGAVFVNAAPEEYRKLALDMDRLRKLPNYLAIRRFGNPPALTDLEGFSLEPEDIRDLKSCRPGKCVVQLPAAAMEELRRTVNWSSSNLASQVNDRARRTALDFLQRYQREGNTALGTYHDQDRPFDVRTQLQSWVHWSDVLPVHFPELSRYLLDYPDVPPAEFESLFYWEKVDFGLKPTLRINHAITYHSAGPKALVQVIMVKQLYASHYFQLALDLTACVQESSRPGEKGFYLISLKGSTQQGLTGIQGSLLRRVVVGKTRSAQEKALIAIKRALEKQP